MATVDRAASPPTRPDLRDPQVREWRSRLARSGVSATVEVTPDETGFGLPFRELHVEFVEFGTALPVESHLWSDEMNAGLVELGVRAVNAANEAVRFSVGLRHAFEEVEIEVGAGGGYFSSALSQLLAEGEPDAEVAARLPYCYSVPLYTGAERPARLVRCRARIEEAIRGREAELTDRLGYPADEARRILNSAIARYLDQRFSIGKRRRMGLIWVGDGPGDALPNSPRREVLQPPHPLGAVPVRHQ